jgi:hypothetical protein
MAFSQKAEKELSTWFQPAYTAFIEKPDPAALRAASALTQRT